MKKQLLFVGLLVSSFMMRAEDVDTVAFWKKTVQLYKQAGYKESDAMLKHAQTNLKRVETLHSHAPSTAAGLAGLWGGATRQRTEAPVAKKTTAPAKKKTTTTKVAPAKHKPTAARHEATTKKTAAAKTEHKKGASTKSRKDLKDKLDKYKKRTTTK